MCTAISSNEISYTSQNEYVNITLMYELLVEKTFDAAHYLENYDGDCARMHGHTYRVQICVAGETLDQKFGMLMDFKEMKKALNQLIAKLDHQVLNEVLDFNTTAELIAKYFYDQVEIVEAYYLHLHDQALLILKLLRTY